MNIRISYIHYFATHRKLKATKLHWKCFISPTQILSLPATKIQQTQWLMYFQFTNIIDRSYLINIKRINRFQFEKNQLIVFHLTDWFPFHSLVVSRMSNGNAVGGGGKGRRVSAGCSGTVGFKNTRHNTTKII